MFKPIKKFVKKAKKWNNKRRAKNYFKSTLENMSIEYRVHRTEKKINIFVQVKLLGQDINIKKIEVDKNG